MNVSAPGSAYVWWARTRELPAGVLDAVLDEADRRTLGERVDRERRESYRCERALVRAVASHLLARDPSEVSVRRRCDRCGSETHGRPFVAGAPFVLSAATLPGLSAVAVANGPVGLEMVSRAEAELVVDAAPVVLADTAIAVLDGLGESARAEAALVATAQVEAYAKASGFALSSVARRVAVSLDPARPQVITAGNEWFTCRIDPDERTVGVLVAEAAPTAVRVGNAARLFRGPTCRLRDA